MFFFTFSFFFSFGLTRDYQVHGSRRFARVWYAICNMSLILLLDQGRVKRQSTDQSSGRGHRMSNKHSNDTYDLSERPYVYFLGLYHSCWIIIAMWTEKK